jgi:hypothetical protein
MTPESAEKFKLLQQDSDLFYEWSYDPGEAVLEHEDDPSYLVDSKNGNESGQLFLPNLGNVLF